MIRSKTWRTRLTQILILAVWISMPAMPAASIALAPGDILISTGIGEIARVDPATGQTTTIVSNAYGKIAVGLDGTIFTADTPEIRRIDPVTGVSTVLVTDATIGSIGDIDVGPDGRLVALTSQFTEWSPGQFREDIRLWNIDPVTGQADAFAENLLDYGDESVVALVGADAYYTNFDQGLWFGDASTGKARGISIFLNGTQRVSGDMRGLVANADGTLAVAIHDTSITSSYALYVVDPATGYASIVNDEHPWIQLAVALGGNWIATTAGAGLFEIDAGTGVASLLGLVGAVDVAVVPIPEPSTGLLVGLGVAWIAARRVRGRQAPSVCASSSSPAASRSSSATSAG